MEKPAAYPNADQPSQGDERFGCADPWTVPGIAQARRDNWMLSYIDILTLMLTLFVLLLVLQPKYDSPNNDGIPELAGLAALTPIERPPIELPQIPDEAVQSGHLLPEETGSIDPSALSAELGLDALAVAPEISIEMLGDAPFTALQALIPPQIESELQFERVNAVPEPQSPGESSAEAEAPTAQPQTDAASLDAEKALHSIRQALAARSLDERLEVSQVAEGVHLEVRDDILFAEGSAHLKPEGRRLLDKLAAVLLRHQGIISVEGHTDDRPIANPRFPSNWELSSGRATTVTRYLIGHGLDAAKLRAVGYADTRPLESNATPEGRARNRRVSLILELEPGISMRTALQSP